MLKGNNLPNENELKSTLADLIASLPVRWFTKSELLTALASRGMSDSTRAISMIRKAAKQGAMFNGCKVHTTGSRHGTRYAFGEQRPEPIHLIGTIPHTVPAELRNSTATNTPSKVGFIDIFHGDNIKVLRHFPDASFNLIYIDPPFNTGHTQARMRIKTERDDNGDRVGFQGRRYRTTLVESSAYNDVFDDYMAFLVPRLEEAFRLLTPTGSFFLHLDYREVHYAKIALDQIFGRESFINEIIWAYDYGARSTKRWSAKHDNILWYAKNPHNYCFNFDEMDRIPYMAPSLVGEEKAMRGKTPTDTWWNTIVSPNGKEKTGYPTQKPLAILNRIVRIHSNPEDKLLDFFAGSGSFGEAGATLGRDVTLIDENPEAIKVMRRRFANFETKVHASGVTLQPKQARPVSTPTTPKK